MRVQAQDALKISTTFFDYQVTELMGQLGKKAYQLIASRNHADHLDVALKFGVQYCSEVANTVLRSNILPSLL